MLGDAPVTAPAPVDSVDGDDGHGGRLCRASIWALTGLIWVVRARPSWVAGGGAAQRRGARLWKAAMAGSSEVLRGCGGAEAGVQRRRLCRSDLGLA